MAVMDEIEIEIPYFSKKLGIGGVYLCMLVGFRFA